MGQSTSCFRAVSINGTVGLKETQPVQIVEIRRTAFVSRADNQLAAYGLCRSGSRFPAGIPLCLRVVIGTENDFTLCIPLSSHDGHGFQIPGVEGHKAGIMYSPPLRPAHSMITSIRPLVIRCTHNFAGAMLYCSSLRMRLRRR